MSTDVSHLECARCDATLEVVEIYQTGAEDGPDFVTFECEFYGVRIVQMNAWLPLDHEATANTKQRPD